MNRVSAIALLNEFAADAGLVRHMVTVEIAMRAYAVKPGEDIEKWSLVDGSSPAAFDLNREVTDQTRTRAAFVKAGQVQTGRDLAQFVAVIAEERRVRRVFDHDARFTVVPASAEFSVRAQSLETDELIDETAVAVLIEAFAFPE